MVQRVLVPVLHGLESRAAINAAAMITDPDNVVLAGIVGIAEGESLSSAALPARHVRKLLRAAAADRQVRTLQHIRVSHKPWDEIVQAVQEEKPDLLILDAVLLDLLGLAESRALRYPPCDIVIAGGNVPRHAANVLVSLRGGPYAELSLRLGVSIGATTDAQ